MLTLKHMHTMHVHTSAHAYTRALHYGDGSSGWESGVWWKTGHTHSEYWWDALQIPHTHTHARLSAHIHNLHLCDLCHDTLSLAFIANILWCEAHCAIWMPTENTCSSSLVHWDSRGEDRFTPSIEHIVIELSPLKSCSTCLEWGGNILQANGGYPH